MTWLKAALFCFCFANWTYGFKYPARPAAASAPQARLASRSLPKASWLADASVYRRAVGALRATGDDEAEGEPAPERAPDDSSAADALLDELVRELQGAEADAAEEGTAAKLPLEAKDEPAPAKDPAFSEAKDKEQVVDVEGTAAADRVEQRLERRTPEEGQLADALLDEMVRDLTEEKERLSEEGDYEKAMEVRDRMRLAHLEEGPRVLARNAEFYRAFSDSDISYMKEIWEKAPDVSCIHPGVPMRIGYNAVIRKWDSMFKGHKENSSERFKVRPGNVRVFVRGTTAVVTCEEKLFRKAAESSKWVSQSLQSTNIFRRSFGEWRMVHHHASPTLDTERRTRGASSAGSQDGLQMLGPFEVRPGSSLNIDAIKDAIRNKLQNSASSQDGLRIISINGGSIDDDDDDDDDEDGELGSQGVDDVAAALSKKIREAIRDSDGDGEASGMIVSVDKADDEKAESLGERGGLVLASSEEDVRKETVSLIRRLSSPEEGRLTARQKQLLLGDVIRAAAERPSRKSLIEVAYSVLMDSESEDEALEEFAEQCILLAEELESNR